MKSRRDVICGIAAVAVVSALPAVDVVTEREVIRGRVNIKDVGALPGDDVMTGKNNARALRAAVATGRPVYIPGDITLLDFGPIALSIS